ncbi:MAG: ribose 5-phosphate isomerase B [Dehalococcoidia bacterium]|nr:ribose 5-phosphate isomerase B [Dehalococcoidia bacterium]MSQ17006.1 ribose 5-phosphate isomerase B [Dehalococcoidia bacterium]
MRLAVGADHAGYELKGLVLEWLAAAGHQVVDLGACEFDAEDDYPDFAAAVARAVQSGEAERGIILCGSGVGACITANKVPGVRAGLCHDTYTSHQGVEHDNMNVLCLGARVIGIETARELLQAFLRARFLPEPRFRRRLEKLLQVEREARQAPSPLPPEGSPRQRSQ